MNLRSTDDTHATEGHLPPANTAPLRHLPGEEGVWVVIFGDLLVFGLFFVTFCYYRAENSTLFAASQLTLDQTLGLINTLLLLTSSWLVAAFSEGAKAAQHGARKFLLGALGCGSAFVAIKILEYSRKIGEGVSLTSNEFFTLYFMYTGIHLLHVLIGMGVLLFLYRIADGHALTADKIRLIEGGASFWHLVDILWIVLFALFYVMR